MDSTTSFLNRGPNFLIRTVVLAMLAAGLMAADARVGLQPVRTILASTLYPLQQLAHLPVAAYAQAQRYLVTTYTLQQENIGLKEQNQALRIRVMQYEALVQENNALRSLVRAQPRFQQKPIAAEIVYTARNAFLRKVTINRGTVHGIAAGSPVVDDIGVVGQVTKVFPLSAEVTLITDKDASVPVQVLRTGMRAVAFGAGSRATLTLPYLAPSVDLRQGDVLLTSGLDGIYPAGLPVGVVVGVERQSSNFARVRLVPSAGVDSHRHVFVLTPNLPRPAGQPPTEAPEKKAPARNKR